MPARNWKIDEGAFLHLLSLYFLFVFFLFIFIFYFDFSWIKK